MEALLLALALALSPVYASASGNVQYFHAILGVFILFRLVRISWSGDHLETLAVLLLILISSRELTAILVQDAPLASLTEAFYITFSVAILLVFRRVRFDDPEFSGALKIGLIFALCIALGGIFVYGSGFRVDGRTITRAVGTFNNPNQLGYFAICIGSIVSLLYLRGRLSRVAFFTLLVAAALLVIASLSRAAILGFGPAMLIAMGTLLNRGRSSTAVLAVSLTISIAVLFLYTAGALDQFDFVERIEATGSKKHDTLASRGYFLPWDQNPFSMLVGMGEHFGTVGLLGKHEIHSTFWSFMIKYGVFGFLLIVLLWIIWTKRIYEELGVIGMSLIVAPATIYGITHNGSRFSLLWILIGLSFNLSLSRALKRDRTRSVPAQSDPELSSWQDQQAPTARFGSRD